MKNKKRMPAFMGPLAAIILLMIVLTIATRQFLTVNNLMNVLRQTAINSMVSLGMLMVLITGGIDISVGPMVALSSCVAGVLLKSGVKNSFVMIVAALLVGLLCGTINGLIFTKMKLPFPFVSTMGSRQIYRGLALLITSAAPIGGFPNGVTAMGSSNIGKFPVCFIVVVLIYSLVHLFLSKTVLGRNIYSVGGNKEAARLAGINVDNTLCFVYSMSGLMCAIAGLIMIGRVGTATPLAGETYDMDAIASCVIGGASLSGGKGTVVGTMIGSLLIAVIRNGLNLLGAQTDVQYMVIGAVIILAVFVDVVRGNADSKARLKERARIQLEK
ncbi:MAG: ABC transporter permease [Bilifractor sp.]|jgi:ribose transport system permease protein